MKVSVHLHTTLQKPTSEGFIREMEVEVADGATLDDLIELLELQVDDEHTLYVVQGQVTERTRSLSDGDVVHFIPAISGGSFRKRSSKKFIL